MLIYFRNNYSIFILRNIARNNLHITLRHKESNGGGHIQRMDQARPPRNLLYWKPMGTRPVGKPRQRLEEDVMEDLKKDVRQKLEGDS